MPKGYSLNLVGQRFGRWTVLEKLETRIGNQVRWMVQCDCGNVSVAPTVNLRSGSSTQCRSCGNSKAYTRR